MKITVNQKTCLQLSSQNEKYLIRSGVFSGNITTSLYNPDYEITGLCPFILFEFFFKSENEIGMHYKTLIQSDSFLPGLSACTQIDKPIFENCINYDLVFSDLFDFRDDIKILLNNADSFDIHLKYIGSRFKITFQKSAVAVFLKIYSPIHGDNVYLKYELQYANFMWRNWAIISKEEIICDGEQYVNLSVCDFSDSTLSSSPIERINP